VAKLLPAVDIGKMHFNKGQLHGSQGIAQGDTGMGIGGRINQNGVKRSPCCLNRIDQPPLAVGLQKGKRTPKFRCQLLQSGIYLLQCEKTVYLRLPLPQQVQIWPVQYQYTASVYSS